MSRPATAQTDGGPPDDQERLEAAYAAKTYADLVPITADLPVTGPRPSGPPVGRPRPDLVPAGSYSGSFALLAETKRTGVWRVPAQHTAFAMMGSVLLDLREAELTAAETEINASSIMGDVAIVVNARTRVLVEGFAVMGEYAESRPRVTAELTPDSPVVRVRGLSLMASVKVQREAMPGESTRRLHR